MKSFEQLAQAAYAAHAKVLAQRIGVNARPWSELPVTEKACWEATARQLWAEFAAVH